MKRLRYALGILSGVMAVATLLAPLFLDARGSAARSTGYLGYFVANYFGYGILLLPFLVKRLDPVLLILVGTLGFSVDEVFSWYAGAVSDELGRSKRFHVALQAFVERRGARAVFILGLLPLPGFVYAVSAFAAGHYKMSLLRYFLANFASKLVRTTITTLVILAVV